VSDNYKVIQVDQLAGNNTLSDDGNSFIDSFGETWTICYWGVGSFYYNSLDGSCVTFNDCPTSATAGDTIGELTNSGNTFPVILESTTSLTEIVVNWGTGSKTLTVSEDDPSFVVDGSITYTDVQSCGS
jgi:hypothetical protein